MTTTAKQTRKPRFRREGCPNFHLTERDREIIRQVYRHRFLSSEYITALMEGGRQGILNRLKFLFHADYLDRPKAQGRMEGNFPLIYALGNKGAELIASEFDLALGSVDWTTKNREAKPVFLEHTLGVARFMVLVELACRKVKELEFIRPEEVIGKRFIVPKTGDKALSWKVEAKRGERRIAYSMVPDNVFGWTCLEDSGRTRAAYFFLEEDRATMPIRSANLGRSSFFKKMVGYFESWKGDLFQKNFGFKNPRVLTLTSSNERIKSMVAAGKELDPRGKGLRMFLFAPAKTLDLAKPEKILGKVWINGRGDSVACLTEARI